VEVNFRPDGVRPVYCKECLAKARARQAKTEDHKKIESQPIIRESGPVISLAEATQRRAPEYKPAKKQRKEPDLAGLRSVLSEVVRPVEKAGEKNQKARDNEAAGESNKINELKPGKPLEL
jgi:hypothetical protein